MSSTGNLFAGLSDSLLAEEQIDKLFQTDQIRIERIVSEGQVSPPDFWFDQPFHEWVIIIQGAARLRIAGSAAIELKSGDYIDIPAHQKHRVDWTDPAQKTIWLAVHYGAKAR